MKLQKGDRVYFSLTLYTGKAFSSFGEVDYVYSNGACEVVKDGDVSSMQAYFVAPDLGDIIELEQVYLSPLYKALS